MSNYEFWDELGKIFNAVVAYQEKSIEFNKRFINPWIRLGNVFDKHDRHQEAMDAYRKAIELDPANAQNWFELGNACFQSEVYDQAIEAFNRAIELDSQFGWAHSNLALALMTQGKYAEAIPLYRKSLDLLEEDKDKAVTWNRLGNVYRKLNHYELAVQAFQKADELDAENAGFRDELDEVAEGPSLVEGNSEAGADQPANLTLSPIQLIVEESHAEEAALAQPSEETNAAAEIPVAAESSEAVQAALEEISVVDPEPEQSAPVEEQTEAQSEIASEVVSEEKLQVPAEASTESQIEVEQDVVEAPGQPATEISAAESAEQNVETVTDAAEQLVEAVGEAAKTAGQNASNEPALVPASGDETVTVAVQNTVETYTDSLSIADTSTETTETVLTTAEIIAVPEPQVEEAAPINLESEANAEAAETPAPVSSTVEEAGAQETVSEETVEVNAARLEVQEEAETVEEPVVESEHPAHGGLSISERAAYEEYLKDNQVTLHVEASVDEQVPQEPIAKIDASGEFSIEVDAKNAHVWNELGNVYFNTGEFDDAIVAYSKAIELDRWFAWPYSNLALAYVQKGRFVEAILLYQRSIELFSSEKDKAISWNRLGNVYRRLNDYDNAIASYQRADELDPDNTTLSLQSRFSLLGSYYMEQKPSYAS